MKRHQQIVMSAATVAAAVQAVGDIHAQSKMLQVPAQDEFRTQALSATSSAQSQALIRSSMATIANTVKIDGKLMMERYASMEGEDAGRTHDMLVRISAVDGQTVDVAQFAQDSTNQSLILDCYTNCHSACHGSRGWR